MMKPGFVHLHFLDSGAFSFQRLLQNYLRDHPRHTIRDFYDSDFFWEYIDSYAAFIRRYGLAIDHFANLDVIGNPELSYRNQQYLQDKHKLRPVPIIHAGTDPDLAWVRKYLEDGHTYLAVGGLVGRLRKPDVNRWLEQFFRLICPPPTYLPAVRVHAFGVMSGPLLHRYPFYSCDATNVGKLGWYGKVFIPKLWKGHYRFDIDARVVALSDRVRGHKINVNYLQVSNEDKQHVKHWLDTVNASGFYNRPLRFETTSDDYIAANYYFMQRIVSSLPPWPWAFGQEKRLHNRSSLWRPFKKLSYRTTLVQEIAREPVSMVKIHPVERSIVLYLSGSYIAEETLKTLGVLHLNRMLTYFDSFKSRCGIEAQVLDIYRERGGKLVPQPQKRRSKRYDKAKRNQDGRPKTRTRRELAQTPARQGFYTVGRNGVMDRSIGETKYVH